MFCQGPGNYKMVEHIYMFSIVNMLVCLNVQFASRSDAITHVYQTRHLLKS